MSFIDCLPIRIPIRSFETLTSQIACNSQPNGIRSINGVATIFFTAEEVRALRSMADFPPLSLCNAAKSLNISEADLLRTTFYHLARKFGRSTHPQTISRFLSGVLSPVLRYCPKCLAKSAYYRLQWRFITLTICPEHECEILGQCTHCGCSIPLLSSPPRIDECPSCHRTLHDCTTLQKTCIETALMLPVLCDLEYLLLPQNWEPQASEVVVTLGNKLAQLREAKHLTLNELSTKIDVSTNMISGIELGNFSARGATFSAYQKYVGYFGYTFEMLFTEAVSSGKVVKLPKLSKTELITASKSAIQKLEADEQEITGKAIAELVGVPRSTLIANLEITTMINDAETQRLRRIEDTLAMRATAFLKDAQERGETCSQDTLANKLGISRAKLRRSESLMQLLRLQSQL